MQRTLMLVIVLALAVAGYWYFASPGSPSGEAERTTRPSADAAEVGDARAADDEKVISTSRFRGAETAGTVALRVVLDGINEDSARKARVTVTGVDARGAWPAEIRDSWLCHGLTSEFDLGPFLESVEGHGDLRVDELEVEVDHPHHLRQRARVPLSGGVELANGSTVHEVRVRLVAPEYWPEFQLAVRDARTRAHLEDVELRITPGGLMAMWGWNAPRVSLGDGLSSPIALMGGRDPSESNLAALALSPAAGESPRPVEMMHRFSPSRGVVVSARAPGYAWGSIVIDVSKIDECELLLKPGSALDVRLTNVQLERYRALETKPTLCVYWIRADGGNQYVRFEPLDETLEAEGLRLEGLKPGGYRVTVELGGGVWRKQPVLARAELSEDLALLAGETREIVLALADPPAPPERGPLGGVVSLPRFGGEKKVRLQIYFQPTQRFRRPDVELSLADLRPVSGALPTWSFRVEDLPVGMYRVQLLPFLKVWMIDLPAGGREDLKLSLPALAEVQVETVDGRTGRRVPLDELHFRRKKPLPGQVQNDRARADTEQPGRFRFWTEPGAISMWPRGEDRLGYGSAGKDVEVVPGLQSVRVELAPACLIRLDFRIDGAAPRLADAVAHWVRYETFTAVRAVDHEGRSLGRAKDRVVEVTAPGVYEINFDGFTANRFHTIPSRRVEVIAGKTTEVIVELQRR